MKFNYKTLSLIFLSILFFLVSIINVVKPNGQTISEKENRKLATFPIFNVENLTNGNYFSQIDNYITDNFLCRDNLINVSETINRLKSIDTYVKSDDRIIYVAANNNAKIMDEDVNVKKNSESFKKVFNATIISTSSNMQINAVSTSSTSKSKIKNIENANIDDKLISNKSDEELEYVSGGYIIYKGIPYCVASDASKKTLPFFKTVEMYDKIFPSSKVSIVLAPQSSIMITDQEANKHILNQKVYIDNIYNQCSNDINKVNPSTSILEHQNEKLFFDYDHHWTQRGAYYAYKDFCNSRNIKPVNIDDLEEVKVTDSWHGSTYKFTGDERFKNGSDELFVYMPSKQHSMSYITQDGNLKNSNCCIDRNFRGYVAILSGDQPYAVITVPDNPVDKTCLVFKDSFGNAFVPFLCEHYGTIVIIDPRHLKLDMYEQLKAYNFSDIIFCTAIYEPGVPAFTEGLKRVVASAIPNEK